MTADCTCEAMHAAHRAAYPFAHEPCSVRCPACCMESWDKATEPPPEHEAAPVGTTGTERVAPIREALARVAEEEA